MAATKEQERKDMEKITTKAQARKLVEKMLGDTKIEIQLYDNLQSNEIINLLPHEELSYSCVMLWRDTVSGEAGKATMTIVSVTDMIFNHRKYINKSGQLAYI